MGMYTECVLKCTTRTKEDAEKIIDLVPFKGSSYYHHPMYIEDIVHTKERWEHSPEDNGSYVFLRFDLKNYGGEIETFLTNILPLVDDLYDDEETCIGWYWYEEAEKPSLIMATDKTWRKT